MAEYLYYPHAYTDEIVLCDCTLEGWAEWFSGPDLDWNRPEAAKDGETFLASMAELHELECVKVIGGWSWDQAAEAELVKGGATFYLRYASGSGWSADNSGATVAEALAFSEDMVTGDRAYVAAMRFVGEVELRYDAADGEPAVVVLRQVGHA